MAVARYQQISEDLTRQISSGALPVGSLLPTEMQLMDGYDASRNTVRMALQQLQARGLISRRRNRGTMVEAVPGGAANFIQSMSFDDLVTLASTARRQIVGSEDVVLDTAAARLLQCQPGSRWFRLSMLRGVAGKARPLGWTDAYVDPHYRQVGDIAADQPDKLLADLIESHFGRRVEGVEQTVSACAVSEQMAQSLGAAKGTPALRVLRHYRDAARALIIVTSSLYPESRYSIVTTLVRSR
ncbi:MULTISPECIES: GntR family transcriptional regulator [Ramlibacter]|nr:MULTISPECIES: GntR family transcriptional regulator [Ramlibacter]MBA2962340.1 GntR family transcriptional regulator [Ramlibacter sp. CGMCC 1.13660]